MPPAGSNGQISAADLYETLSSGEPISVLDVRDRDEVDAWRITGDGVQFAHVPLVRVLSAEANDAVGDFAADLDLPEPIVAVCARGEASDHVAAALRDADHEAFNLAGGMEGWARLYVGMDVSEVSDPGSGATVSVRQYLRPSSGCVSYLLASESEAVVIDPLGAFVDRYVADASERDVSITHAIDTHVHADHFSGVRELAAETGATPVMPTDAIDRGVTFEVSTVGDGEVLPIGDADLQATHAPGHTTEMTVFELGDLLLSGDSLFLQSVARPDLERGGEGARELAESLYETLADLAAKPGETLVAPGHVGPTAVPADDGTYTATLEEIRDRVDLFDLEKAAFVDRILSDMPPRPANYERIIAANLGRETIGCEEAFELELGPNNCAVTS